MNNGTTWPPADVVAKIAADYPEESPATVVALLEDYCDVERLRVIRCILHLAAGNAGRLLTLIGNANTDYRDVIHWAEYDLHGKKLHDFNQPFADAATARDINTR